MPPSTPPEPATHAEANLLRTLLRDPKARAEHRLFVAEGPNAVAAALDHEAPVATVFVGRADAVADRAAAAGIPVRALGAKDVRRIGDTRTPQPVFATIDRVGHGIDALVRADLSIVCVQVNDPGNAGTLMRSAAAAGATALGLGTGSVDAYNPKVIRSSAGACFGIATVEGLGADEMLDALGAAGVQRVGAVPRGGQAPEAIDLTRPTAIVLGHETRGFASELHLDAQVTIPMVAAESLNVAMAGTVLLFEAARQRRSAS